MRELGRKLGGGRGLTVRLLLLKDCCRVSIHPFVRSFINQLRCPKRFSKPSGGICKCNPQRPTRPQGQLPWKVTSSHHKVVLHQFSSL